MGYSKRRLSFLERIILFDSIHMMSMTSYLAIGVKILRIDSICSLEKKFTKLICMSTLLVLYLTVNQLDSCHVYLCCPLT